MPALTAPCSDLDSGQPQGHHAGAPSQRYQAPGNNYVTPLQLSISLHAGRHIFVSETPGIVSASPENKQGMSHRYD